MIKGDCRGNYIFDPQRLYNFDKYIEDLSGISIYYGLGMHNTEYDDNFKVKLIVEHPNFLYHKSLDLDIDIDSEINKYDLILNICPYTSKMLNSKYNTDKCKYSFFPLPETIFTYPNERIYDIFYSGHYNANIKCLPMIYEILHKYMGNKYYELHNMLNSSNGYNNKINIYTQTKICIVHNILADKSYFPGFNSFNADKYYIENLPWHTDHFDYVPQQKTRMFEGAMAGCILLVYKDNYNIVEDFFEENKEFIYFTDKNDLDTKIELILNNYDKYKIIGENARNKCLNNYTFKHFIDIIKFAYINRKT
jgi:hypothetical protein